MKKPPPAATQSRPTAQQRRSQETFDKLVSATTRVLDRDGLEGATVPRIAAEAKLSAASIYRRFTDKDDLLRAAFLQIVQDAHKDDARHVRGLVARKTLAGTVEALIAAILKDYRDHPRLLTALFRMVESEPDSGFSSEILRLSAANFDRIAGMLLVHRKSIRHPNPERAVRFAILSAISSVELAALGQVSLWRVTLHLNDKSFAAELTRQMLAYLWSV